jgi:hypothetical protein|tara:strand:+ start:805 stop:1038 length:234 start_codon:yes stop_codon:yes gene_type:complete
MTINYSEKLKEAVMDYVKAERFITDDSEYTPVVIALSKKEYPKEYKNYKTDWVDEDDFLVGFEDIIKIVSLEEESND